MVAKLWRILSFVTTILFVSGDIAVSFGRIFKIKVIAIIQLISGCGENEQNGNEITWQVDKLDNAGSLSSLTTKKMHVNQKESICGNNESGNVVV